MEFKEGLGDYDVFAVNKSSKQIWIVECKVIKKVGSVYEDQALQKDFFIKNSMI